MEESIDDFTLMGDEDVLVEEGLAVLRKLSKCA